MKVTLEKDYRRLYTLEDLDRAKEVIACEKEDESTIASWAVYAVNEVLRTLNENEHKGFAYADESDIFRATARTAKNCRAWNAYGETHDMDVWIEAYAYTYNCFIEIGAYLSDIFQTGAEPYAQHTYYRIFEQTKGFNM